MALGDQSVRKLVPVFGSPLPITGTAEHMIFPSGGGGLTSDFNWGAEETLLLVSPHFFGKGGGTKAPPAPLPHPGPLALPSLHCTTVSVSR